MGQFSLHCHIFNRKIWGVILDGVTLGGAVALKSQCLKCSSKYSSKNRTWSAALAQHLEEQHLVFEIFLWILIFQWNLTSLGVRYNSQTVVSNFHTKHFDLELAIQFVYCINIVGKDSSYFSSIDILLVLIHSMMLSVLRNYEVCFYYVASSLNKHFNLACSNFMVTISEVCIDFNW